MPSVVHDELVRGRGHVCIDKRKQKQNAHYFTYVIFKLIFLKEIWCILISISLEFAPKRPIVSIDSYNGLVPDRRQSKIWGINGLVYYYSIRVPGWVLKCLNLITAPGSVSNQPGSVTWLATAGISKIHAVSWRNHIENQTTKGAQNM